MPAADTPYDIDDAIVHRATPPERLRIHTPGMAAETAGHLKIMPGPEITDTHTVAAFWEFDDVPVLFHLAMLGLMAGSRPAPVLHGCLVNQQMRIRG